MDGSVGRRLGHGAPDQSGHDCVIGAVSPGGGIRGDVEHGGAVLGGREQGEPDESAPVAGEHGAVLRRRRARMRDGEQLRLRECSVAACRVGPVQERGELRTDGVAEVVQVDGHHVLHVHAGQRNPVP